MRQLKRSIAKANMRDAGLRKINRMFAPMWRNWITPPVWARSIIAGKRRARETRTRRASA